ncbi:hypothetical protein HQ563_14315, partial [bacterium]|nr:hypothetical protein [bacterium]
MKKAIMNYFVSVVFLSLGFAVGVANADVKEGLLVHWTFDEGEGTTAVDRSGNGHDGILVNDPQWVEGKVKGALEFAGDGDFVEDDDGGDYLNGLSAVSVAMWIKSDVTATDKGFIIGMQPAGGDRPITMRYDSAGAGFGGTNLLKMGVASTDNQGADGQQIESSNNSQTTEWQHVCMTWESGGVMYFYINGVEDTPTGRNNANLGGTTCDNTTLLIGKGGKDEGASASWDGLIDDVRIYNRTLSASEIVELFEWTGGAGAVATPNPAEAGQTVTLIGSGPDDATSFAWEQVIVGDEPTVTIADPNSATTTFDAPTREIGYILTFRLTVVSPELGTVTEECLVYITAPNEPRLAPGNVRATLRHLGFLLEWDPLLDAVEYGVGFKLGEGLYFWFWTANTYYDLANLTEGEPTTLALTAKNSYGEGVLSDEITLVPMRNAALPAGTTPPTDYVTILGAAVPGMNNGAHDDNNDSSDGQFKTEDYWGYLWEEPVLFDHIVYYTGGFSSNGGWFTSLTVEYTQDGTIWTEAPGVTISPPYDFTNSAAGRVNFTRYDISLWPLRGTGIRIYGTPGGTLVQTATSVAELEVYGDTSRGQLVVYGVDDTFDERSQVALDGSHSFSERGPLSGFAWVQTGGPTVNITDADQAKASFTAPGVDADTVLTFEFTAGDGTDTDTDEVSITVRNLVTTAVAGVGQTVYEGTVVNLDGTGSITTSGNITYAWTQTDGTEAILTGANTATPSFTAPAIWDNTDEVVFSLNVDDGEGGDSTDTVSVYVNNPMFFAPAEEGDMADDPWHLKAQDIYPGTPAIAGSSSYGLATDTYTVTANGNDIWGTNDQFRFLFLEIPAGVGDFSVSVRVDGPPAGESWPDGWTKAGIMFRQDLDANSKDMYLICSRDNGIAMQYRTTKGAGAARQGGAASQQPYVNGTNIFVGPVWLRLERQGDLFLGYYSFDGSQWLPGPWDYPAYHTIAMQGPFYVGICLTSHTIASTGTAVFGDLRFKDQEAHVITDAYAFRTLPASYEPGGTTDVSLSVRTNPDNPPDTVTVLENIPTGLSAVPGSMTHGGIVVGDTIAWTLTGEGITDVAYSLGVPGDTSGALNFGGAVSFPGTTVDIYGDDIIYENPVAPQNLDAEMLLTAELSWSANAQEGIIGYRLFRSVNGQAWEELGFVSGTSYVDKWIDPGSTYNYKVLAVNAVGAEGPFSDPTGEKMIVMEIREAEDFNYGGGLWPFVKDVTDTPANESPATDDLGAEYDFFFAADIPVDDWRREHRPL